MKEITFLIKRCRFNLSRPIIILLLLPFAALISLPSKAHKTDPPVHQYIAEQSAFLWSAYHSGQYPGMFGSHINDIIEGSRREDSSSGRYDVSEDAGTSRVVLKILSAGTIEVEASIPGCGVPTVGRYCPVINAPVVEIIGE